MREYVEADLENVLVDGIDANAGMCLKVALAGMTGFPDRTCLLPGGRVVFVELKKLGGRLSMRQRFWHTVLRDLGFRVEVFWTFQQVTDFLTNL